MKTRKITTLVNDLTLRFYPPGEVDWKKYANQYDAVTSDLNKQYRDLISLPFLPLFVKNFKYDSNRAICDVGAGTGNFSIPFAEKYPSVNVYHIDSDETSLFIARKKAENKGIRNIYFFNADVENLKEISEKNAVLFDTIFMFHVLYSTRSKSDPEKPKRILEGVRKSLSSDGGLFIADIEREMNLAKLIGYVTMSSIKKYGFFESIKKFKNLDQAKIQNSNIVRNQREGNYIIQDLEGLVNLLESAGFDSKNIFFKSDKYYFGYDNVVAINLTSKKGKYIGFPWMSKRSARSAIQ